MQLELEEGLSERYADIKDQRDRSEPLPRVVCPLAIRDYADYADFFLNQSA
jgi:hypothetical protein